MALNGFRPHPISANEPPLGPDRSLWPIESRPPTKPGPRVRRSRAGTALWRISVGPLVLLAVAPVAGASEISVLNATYGGSCGIREDNAGASLKASCDGAEQCEYTVNAKSLGDPARGCKKDYVARYTCKGSTNVKTSTISAEAGSGSPVVLDCSDEPSWANAEQNAADARAASPEVVVCQGNSISQQLLSVETDLMKHNQIRQMFDTMGIAFNGKAQFDVASVGNLAHVDEDIAHDDGPSKTPMGTNYKSGEFLYSGGRLRGDIDRNQFTLCSADLLLKFTYRNSETKERIYIGLGKIRYIIQPVLRSDEYNIAVFGNEQVLMSTMQQAFLRDAVSDLLNSSR